MCLTVCEQGVPEKSLDKLTYTYEREISKTKKYLTCRQNTAVEANMNAFKPRTEDQDESGMSAEEDENRIRTLCCSGEAWLSQGHKQKRSNQQKQTNY